jgi:hypothetical protein
MRRYRGMLTGATADFFVMQSCLSLIDKRHVTRYS